MLNNLDLWPSRDFHGVGVKVHPGSPHLFVISDRLDGDKIIGNNKK